MWCSSRGVWIKGATFCALAYFLNSAEQVCFYPSALRLNARAQMKQLFRYPQGAVTVGFEQRDLTLMRAEGCHFHLAVLTDVNARGDRRKRNRLTLSPGF